MDLDEGNTVNLEVESKQEDGTVDASIAREGVGQDDGEKPTAAATGEKLSLEMESSSAANAKKEREQLEVLIKHLTSKGYSIKPQLVSKLEVARVQSADEERLARRAAWIEESRKEVLRRQQGKTAEELFPELVWKLILEKLDDPKTKMIMSSMDLKWRELLKDERTTFLFHEVFPLLHPYFKERNDQLRVRLVSKEWKRSMESYLQNLVIYGRKPDLVGMAGDMPFAGRDFLNVHFQGSFGLLPNCFDFNANPFISRKMFLGLQQFSPYSTPGSVGFLTSIYWPAVDAFLHRWGDQLWAVDILVGDMNCSPSDIYDRLRGLLNQMPNLRYLSVDGTTYTRPSTDFAALEKKLEEEPLPDLPHLVNFICSVLPAPIITAILNKYSATLENVFVMQCFGTPNLGAANSNASFPNMKSFSHSASFQSVVGSRFAAELPSLEVLSLIYEHLEATDVPKLFHCVNEFGGTLKDLTFVLKKAEGPMTKLGEGALKMLSLDLPHLEELTLLVCRINLKTIDIILPLTSLRKLNIVYEKRIHGSGKKKQKKKPQDKAGPSKSTPSSSATTADADDTDQSEIIKFQNYTNRLYESNIWKLLPELKTVKICILTKLYEHKRDGWEFKKNEFKNKAYTREGYQQYSKSAVSSSSNDF